MVRCWIIKEPGLGWSDRSGWFYFAFFACMAPGWTQKLASYEVYCAALVCMAEHCLEYVSMVSGMAYHGVSWAVLFVFGFRFMETWVGFQPWQMGGNGRLVEWIPMEGKG